VIPDPGTVIRDRSHIPRYDPVYLDNFVIIGQNKAECEPAFSTLLQLVQDLEFQVSWREIVGPSRKLSFLGVELDTLRSP